MLGNFYSPYWFLFTGFVAINLVGGSTNDHVVFSDEDLTEAEERIASAVARGLSNKEIASELQISFRTVENHISHILAKKNFGNRVEIARFVLARTHAE